MSDTNTTALRSAEDPENPGHGRHRGSESAEEREAAPHGRHRKPSEQTAA